MPMFPVQTFFSPSSQRLRELNLSYGWSNNNPDLLAKQLIDATNRHGIEIPHNTRYKRFIDEIGNPSSDIKLKIVAYQEIFQLLVAINNISEINEWRQTIIEAIKYEAAIPQALANQTRGRDFLFELYIAGRLNAAGIETQKGEPDIICRKGNLQFGVAAKRIKSKNKIFARIKAAREQIIKSKMPGIIALDFSPLQPDYYGDLVIESNADFSNRARDFLHLNFEEILPDISEICNKRQVFGVIAFATIAGIQENLQTFQISSFHNGRRMCPEGSIKAQYMWEIVDSLGRSIPHYF